MTAGSTTFALLTGNEPTAASTRSPFTLSHSLPTYSFFLRPGSVFIGSQSSVDRHHHHHHPSQNQSPQSQRRLRADNRRPPADQPPARISYRAHPHSSSSEQSAQDQSEHHISEVEQLQRELPSDRILPHDSGSQCLDQHQITSNPPEWTVRVTITHSDHRTGKLAGMMQADGLFNTLKQRQYTTTDHSAEDQSTNPNSSSMIITAWEGETIDLKKSPKQLWTIEHEDVDCYKLHPASASSLDPSRSRHHFQQISTFGSTSHLNDLRYWSKTKAFLGLDPNSIFQTLENDPIFLDALDSQFILMRWKETNFVNCEPTQSGLSIQGFYYVCLEKLTGLVEAYYYDPASLPYQKLQLKPIGTNGFGFGSMKLV
ncbi:hypothetical protein PCASD_12699 [Puccinia coronata f. sp. avenae]|nr:hypothetical protein PCASD_12699 [Puccinia coronata f. sp. avenae]